MQKVGLLVVVATLVILMGVTDVLGTGVGGDTERGGRVRSGLAQRVHTNKRHHKLPPGETIKQTGVVQYSPSANKVFWTKSSTQYVGHEDSIVAAWGSFADTLNSTGWGELTVVSSGKVSDFIQAYAVGYAEGALTAQRIYELFTVIHDVHAKKPEVGEFIRAQDRFIRTKIDAFDAQHKLRRAADARRMREAGIEVPAVVLAEIERSVEESDVPTTATDAATDAATDVTSTATSTEAESKPNRIRRRSTASRRNEAVDRVLKRARAVVSASAARPTPTDAEWSEFELVYWFNVKLVMAQFDGLLAGYNRYRNKETTRALTVEDLWLVNNDGDILDIERAVSPGRVFSNPTAPTHTELIELLAYNSRCSVMVKWTGDDLLCGHATWDDYNEMNRIYKFYQFKFSDPLHATSVQSQRTHMSSYPGMIFSSDDFYVLDSGLVLLETTLNILNEKLYSHADPQSTVMAWIRNLIANRLASTGKEWTALFGHYNSGTYNNQWMVVDYKLFNKASPTLAPGTLWLVEQIPGFTKSADVTNLLQQNRYWASYNRPFFQETNELSMFEHFATKSGSTQREKEIFTYSQCPRAKIFAREAADIDDLEDLKSVLRLNTYVTDPVSAGCPGDAIAARYDLQPNSAKCDVLSLRANGATDAKVTNAEMVSRLEAEAVAGPTDDDQEPFDWSRSKFKKPPGQPDVFDFDWKIMKFDKIKA